MWYSSDITTYGGDATMEKAKVYFTDFHTQAFGDSLPTKLKKLVKKAGIQDLDPVEKGN